MVGGTYPQATTTEEAAAEADYPANLADTASTYRLVMTTSYINDGRLARARILPFELRE